jgi:PAS domain S-box-containing protein
MMAKILQPGVLMLSPAASSSVSPTSPVTRRLNLVALLLLGLAVTGMVLSMRTNQGLHRDHLPVGRCMSSIQTSLALGHLWFEEVLAGDREENLREVQAFWDDAEELAHAVLEGRPTRFGTLPPLQDQVAILEMRVFLTDLGTFREVAENRFAQEDEAGAGSQLDQEFDHLFYHLLESAGSVHHQIIANIAREASRLETLQWLLLMAILILAALVIFSMRRDERRLLAYQRKLETSEERFRGIFEAAAEGIFLVDPESTMIVNANPSASRILGYSEEEMRSLRVSDVHTPEARHDGMALFQELREKGQASIAEIDCLTREGLTIPVSIIGRIIELDGRQLACGFFTDLTQEKAANQEKLRLEGQLLQAQKMEAIGNLAGGIAHDFNNLLQAILGYAELLNTPDLNPEDHRQDVESIRYAASRAAELTRQLLVFSRRQVIEPVDLNLNQAIGDLVGMLDSMIGETITIDFLPGNQLGTVSMDGGQLEQVLMNLCINARDAMGSQGRLTIETENVLVDEDYCRTHEWSTPGRYVLLTVTDSGEGMSRETMSQIFEPFFTTKEVGKGTGLGLATVYGIVKQNQGMIHVYSEVGTGTTFKIYLPLTERPATEVGPKIARPVAGGQETILVAEDDPAIRALVTKILEKSGYQVLAAADGREAVALFSNQPEAVDLALLDVVMPEMGGREAQEAMHEIKPGLPVIFASGYSQNAIHTDFVLGKGRHLINKPYAREALLKMIRDLLDT